LFSNNHAGRFYQPRWLIGQFLLMGNKISE
jgi:hypothetical protein